MKIKKDISILILIFCLLLTVELSLAAQHEYKGILKENSFTGPKGSLLNPDRVNGIHDGNLVRVRFSNYGSFGRYLPRLEWPAYSGHEYGYEFGPMVAAEFVRWDSVNAQWDTIHCAIEGILDGGDDDLEPYPGYHAPYPNECPAMSDSSSTWPPEWSEWPGQFGPGVIMANQESYYAMSDQASNGVGNSSPVFDYYPEDSSLQGLAIEISSRGYQWLGAEYEDFIIVVYEIKNIGYKSLDKVLAGYFVDLDMGGIPDYIDDRVSFNIENNLVYSYDSDNQSPNFPGDVGWVGFKFLESPFVDDDGVDNDNDGMIDESQNNLVDDDGDWDLTDQEAIEDPNDFDQVSDDIGADGIANTWDEGEGDGFPTPGEPDYEMMDIHESDQLGLTSMTAHNYLGEYYAGNDSMCWIALTPGSFLEGYPGVDLVFFFGSGYFSLDPGESQPMSIAVVLGADSTDLWHNSHMAQFLYERFPGQPKTCCCYGGQDSSGNTWSLLDSGGDVLENDDWVYIAWVGMNGIIDPPAGGKNIGGVGGDDRLVAEGGIQDGRFNLSVTTTNRGWGHPSEGEDIYCRIFDDSKESIGYGNYYANSQTSTVNHEIGEKVFHLFPGDPGGGYTDTPLGGVSIGLLSFEAVGGDAQVILNWKTASEVNNLGFHIERSLDTIHFQRITETIIPGVGSSENINTYAYVDRELDNGVTYYYNLISVDMAGLEATANERPLEVMLTARMPGNFFLKQNYPNPFNPLTEIVYAIPEDAHVTVRVYNVQGAEVASLIDMQQKAGIYTVHWNASDEASGIYFCRLQAGGHAETVKMVLLR